MGLPSLWEAHGDVGGFISGALMASLLKEDSMSFLVGGELSSSSVLCSIAPQTGFQSICQADVLEEAFLLHVHMSSCFQEDIFKVTISNSLRQQVKIL